MSIKKILTLSIIFLLNVTVGCAQDDTRTHTIQVQTHTPVEVNETNGHHLKSVLAIDMDYDGFIDNTTINQGNDAILLLHLGNLVEKTNTSTPPRLRDLSYIPNYETLALLDEDKSGRIDNHDSAFNYLYLLVRYSKNRYQIVSIRNVGIRAIFLPEPFLQPLLNKGWNLKEVANSAIMSDGSRRQLKLLKINHKLLLRSV